MPVIIMESTRLSKEQKTLLVKEFTESAAKIMNMTPESFIVYLKENEPDNIGLGGKLLSELKK